MVLERQAMFDTVKRVINPIWNAFSFLVLYAGADGTVGHFSASSEHLLDHYILAKTGALRDEVTAAMDAYDLSRATDAIEEFLDALTNWYVRRSRDRFWAPASDSSLAADKQAAYDTLHTVLVTLVELTAPLLPMLSEHIYRALTGERSVHLVDWPEAKEFPRDPARVATMELVREICSSVHSIRKAAGLRARLPLRTLTIASTSELNLDPYLELIAEETNVKEIQISRDFNAFALERLILDPRVLGPRLGPRTQDLLRAAKEGRFTLAPDHAVVEGVLLAPGEYQVVLEPLDAASMRLVDDRRAVVALDTTVDDALEEEGLARDLIRLIQQHRKDMGYEITTRITLHLGSLATAPRALAAIEHHGERIAREVLAEAMLLAHDPLEAHLNPRTVNLGDEAIDLATAPSSSGAHLRP